MNPLKTISGAALLAGALAASPAHAQEKFYAGASIGASSIDDSITAGLITSGATDGKDTGYKLFGGYRFSPHLAAEVAWVDLGKASYSGNFFATPVTGGTVKVSGLNLSAVGLVPLNPAFDLFGKLGMFAWEAKASDTTGGVPFSSKTDGADLSLGIGLQYHFTKNVSARLEWESFELDSDKASLLSAGVIVKF